MKGLVGGDAVGRKKREKCEARAKTCFISTYLGIITLFYSSPEARENSATVFTASSKSGIQSALLAAPPHLTTPFLSTAKLPLVCHLLPLSVGLFHCKGSETAFQDEAFPPRALRLILRS